VNGPPTAQRLDPLGGITARVLVAVAVGIAFVEAAVMSSVTADQISHPVFEAAALIAIGVSGVYYVRATSPFRPAFSMRSLTVVYLSALAAVVFNSAAQWGSNAVVRDDWAPLALATITLTLGSYRPAREIVLFSALTATVVGALGLVQADTFRSDIPELVYALIPATPILAAGVAAAAFSRSLVGSLLDWRSSAGAREASARIDAQQAEPAAPARASHLVHLDEHVIPFLQVVSRGSELSEADGARARTLARELRALMMIDTERSWLERIVRRVDDPGRLAERMVGSERGFLRAVVAHLRHSEVFDDETIRLTLREEPAGCTVTVEVESRPGRDPRVHLAPYIAVAHSLFSGVDWQISGATLTLVLVAGTPAPSPRGRANRGDALTEEAPQ
jgi:hypothetical protein